jgi:hypothetical protein
VREKLNSNPIAQVGLIAVLVVLGLVFFLKSSGGEEAEEAGSGPTVATVNGSTATGVTPGEAVESAISGLEEGAVETGATEVPTAIPAPPPPAAFTSAYDAGQTVVLLVVHDGGIDDRLTSKAADQIKGEPGVTLLRVPLEQLPRYAGVTLGLEVNRMPALIVMRPQRLSGGVPQATVDYGFQTAQSVVQAVRDASYAGPEETYHPD